MFFNIGNNTENIISEFSEIKRNHNSTNGSEVEFEVRFGKYNFEKNHDGKTTNNFDSNVEAEFFYNLKNSLHTKNFETTISKTKEYIYQNPNGKGSIKKIVSENSDKYMIKNTFKKYNIFDYNIRLSLANEKYFDKSYFKNFDFNNYEIIRDKTRYSFNLNIGVVDLTIVHEENKQKNTNIRKYEIEFEVSNTCDVETLINIIGGILQTKQKNIHVIPNNERYQVLQEYKNLVSTPYFVGAQPETLHKNHLSKLYQEEYSVTDKADGDRMMMLIDKNRNIYFIDNNMNEVMKTDIKSNNYHSCLIDGELIRSENDIKFYAFDLIAYNEQDIRGNTNFLLKQRLEITNDIVNNMSSENYKIFTKKFLFKNVFLGSEVILNDIGNKPYNNDGLIYTPVNEPYPVSKKWKSLLKWKPAELNTIDFYSVKENDVWKLYVQHQITSENKLENKKNNTECVLFDINKLCPNPIKLDEITFQTSFDENTIDPTTNNKYESNTVIEYVWDFNDKKFKPLRTRWDKTANPKKHGNFSSIACDIWNNIHNPIEKELIFKFTTYNKEDKYFEKMRRFHNRVKEMLYNKYTTNSDNLLELCSGKGGDMHKWINNEIKNIDGYDVSEKNIAECNKRLEQMKHKIQNFNYNFYKLDLTDENSCDIISKKNAEGYDNICCNFGIHYFFQSQNTLDNIINIFEKNLKTGGHIILSFMDDSKIDELFAGKETTFDTKDGEIVYFMKKENTESKFGKNLRVVLNGNNILGEGSNEYIINFQEFVNKMATRNFKVVETELFQNIYEKQNENHHLEHYEKKISFLNRFCVFQKTDGETKIYTPKQKRISINSLINPDIVKTEFRTIDLHKYDISVFKFTSLYDILDVLNCINYKYYKSQVENKQISSFNDIKTLFENYNIPYIPKFLQSANDIEEYESISNYIYFTYYKHTLEKKTESDGVEILEFDNWYVILHKDKLLFNKSEINKNFNTKIEYQNKTEEQEIEKTIDIKTIQNNPKLEDSLKKKIETALNGKMCKIPELKNILKECKLKTSGNKDELVKRLKEYIEI